MSKPGAVDEDGTGFFDLEEFPAFPDFTIPFLEGIGLTAREVIVISMTLISSKTIAQKHLM